MLIVLPSVCVSTNLFILSWVGITVSVALPFAQSLEIVHLQLQLTAG